MWSDLYPALDSAVSIAWDRCHKIYVLMDEEQHALMQEYGYDILMRIDETGGVDEAAAHVLEWYDESCPLKFVQSVRTVEGNPNAGFDWIIEQGAEDEEYDY